MAKSKKYIYDILLKVLKSCGDTMENEGEGPLGKPHMHTRQRRA